MVKRINIKQSDLEIAPINFGGNVFGWTLDEKQSFNILDSFVEAGFNFIDTADMYSYWVDNGLGGQSETILGKWIKTRNNRSNIVIATKVGGHTGVHPNDTSKKHILKTVDESLKRLQTDYIDLYYTHYDDEKTPLEETLSAYDEIVKAGKVKYIAASNVSPKRLRESLKISEENNFPKYIALQPHYNLLVREQFEKEYAPIVKEFDMSVFPYWSLEAGFLTGKYKTESDFDKTARGAGIKQHFNARGKAILKALDSIAEKHGSKPATIALAWLLANPLVTAPIVSATSESQLETLFAAPELTLDGLDIELLDEASK